MMANTGRTRPAICIWLPSCCGDGPRSRRPRAWKHARNRTGPRSCRWLEGSQLWTRQVQLTLCSENIAVQVCYPLASARRNVEVTYCCLNLRSDVVPIELWIFVNDICRRIVAKRFVQADLFKFIEQRICFSQIVG